MPVHNTGTKLVMVLWPFVAEQRTEDESGVCNIEGSKLTRSTVNVVAIPQGIP